jgi:DNA-binding beta-propeller fold protein YncE
VVLKRGLEVPDGVAQSASGRWIAVSNHNKNAVFLYRNDGTVDRASKPDGILRGILYPHGIRFTPDETSVVVADAGRPFIHVFESSDGEWFGERTASDTIRAVSDETFERGHYSREEGGPKGIDLTQDGSLLVASCDEQPLAIFDVGAILGGTTRPVSELEATRTREAILRYGHSSRTPIRDATRLMASDSRNWVHLFFIRWVWRITAPMWAVAAKLTKKPAA